MNYLAELKRRNIFKVAVAYLALGWVVVQITDVAVPALNLSPALNGIVFYLGIVGFPFALFFAWAFELTPDGVKKTTEVDVEESIRTTTGQKLNFIIIGLLAIAVIFLMYDKNNDELVLVQNTNSIAVLPFVNMSGDADNEYFSDGLSEEILNVLVKLPNLKVAGRTSSFAFKGENNDLRKIGEALGVDHLLEGSVRKQDNRVRITAQLIRSEDGFHLWSETFNRELKDIFIVQEEIANAIGSALALKMDLSLTPTLISRTTNMEAFDLYLEGKSLVSKRGVKNISRALTLLNNATKLDENYAAAWGMLAQAHSLAHYSKEIETSLEGMFLGEEAARKALRLDPSSSHAHGALGDILKDKFQWQEAEEHYLLALQSDPENIESNGQYGQFLMRTGKFRDALPYVEKARVLAPDGPVYYLVEAMVRYYLNQKEQALSLFDKGVEIGQGVSRYPPGTRFMYGFERDSLETSKKYLRLLMEHNETSDLSFFNENLIDKMGNDPAMNIYLNEVFQYLKANPEELNSENAIASMVYALLAAKAGNYSLTLDFLEMESNLSIQYMDHDMLGTTWNDIFSPIYNDPRFNQIRRKYGLVEYWRNSGWPDRCHPVGNDDFECRVE